MKIKNGITAQRHNGTGFRAQGKKGMRNKG
jgi:hypothetical protein